jgi:hypothetical protein
MAGRPAPGKPQYDLIPTSVHHAYGPLLNADGTLTTVRLPRAFGEQRIDLQWVLKRLAKETPADYAINKAYYDGDHWQDGKGWAGPIPEQTSKDYQKVYDLIKRTFVSRNCVAEVTNRHVAGVTGREPTWNLVPRRALKPTETPTEEEQKLIDEADAALTEWWDERGLYEAFQDAITSALLAGRGGLRMYIPPGLVANGIVLDDKQIAELEGVELDDDDDPTDDPLDSPLSLALDSIYVHHPEPDTMALVTDATTMEQMAIYAFRDENGKRHGEIAYKQSRRRRAPTIIAELDDSARQRKTLSSKNCPKCRASTIQTPREARAAA